MATPELNSSFMKFMLQVDAKELEPSCTLLLDPGFRNVAAFHVWKLPLFFVSLSQTVHFTKKYKAVKYT